MIRPELDNSGRMLILQSAPAPFSLNILFAAGGDEHIGIGLVI